MPFQDQTKHLINEKLQRAAGPWGSTKAFSQSLLDLGAYVTFTPEWAIDQP